MKSHCIKRNAQTGVCGLGIGVDGQPTADDCARCARYEGPGLLELRAALGLPVAEIQQPSAESVAQARAQGVAPCGGCGQ